MGEAEEAEMYVISLCTKEITQDSYNAPCACHNKHADDTPEHVFFTLITPFTFDIEVIEILHQPPKKHHEPGTKNKCQERTAGW